MKPLVGLGLGGAALTPRTAAQGGALLGEPVWGAAGLLRDLELRLGLSPVEESTSARGLRWTARIKSLCDQGAFYRRSFAVDELGTAAKLLEWRDALVEAGWNGAPIADGGDRLDAVAALERHDRAGMPCGPADRLVRVERALASADSTSMASSRLYDSIVLVDDASLWPQRWQRIFRRLEARETRFSRLAVELSGARASSDLGVLQARLRGERRAARIQGDGSLLLLTGDTPGDLAELTASLLAQGRAAGTADVVIRSLDAASLEAALARQGLPAQGCSSESVWRPAMQVLPLAIELAFEPRDPYRVLELLTLAVGPFRGSLGGRLARAVARQPGVGGKEWMRQKAEAAKRLREHHTRLERDAGKSETEADRIAGALVDERMKRVATWLEGPGASPAGATREELLTVAERVRLWLQSRLRGGELDVYGAAYSQAVAFGQAVAHDTRDTITREDARQLLDDFARTAQGHCLSVEAAGRATHLAHPAALLAPCDRVFLWSFVADVEHRPPRSPWNEGERAALLAAGVSFADPLALLRNEAEAWRRAVLAARKRVVLVVPRTIKGTATSPHPLWDEICARLALDESGVARITRHARRVLDGSGPALVPLATLQSLPLPEGRGAWSIPPDALRASAEERKTSVTALEKIATCPLAWVLEHRADLRSGAMSRVATGALLNGGLSHRLVEELHAEGAFELVEASFLERAAARFEELLRTEGATLLLPGASIERLQLTRQVRQAMRDLYRYLERSGYKIASVEEVVTTGSAVGALHGRLDLRLVDREGLPAILDLKWGASTYRTLLAQGRAVQLAVYSRAVAESGGHAPPPPAAYFALSNGQVLTTDPRMKPTRPIDGPSLEETWRRVESTAKAVMDSHDRGKVYVSATKRALPLLDALGVADAHRSGHFEAAQNAGCAYCDYDALCGRKWEAFA